MTRKAKPTRSYFARKERTEKRLAWIALALTAALLIGFSAWRAIVEGPLPTGPPEESSSDGYVATFFSYLFPLFFLSPFVWVAIGVLLNVTWSVVERRQARFWLVRTEYEVLRFQKEPELVEATTIVRAHDEQEAEMKAEALFPYERLPTEPHGSKHPITGHIVRHTVLGVSDRQEGPFEERDKDDSEPAGSSVGDSPNAQGP